MILNQIVHFLLGFSFGVLAVFFFVIAGFLFYVLISSLVKCYTL